MYAIWCVQTSILLHRSTSVNVSILHGYPRYAKDSGYTNMLQDKILFCAFEAGNIVCWLVNPPIAKLDLFRTADWRWICKTYAENYYRNLATLCRLVQSPTLQLTISVGVPAINMVKVYECHPLGYAHKYSQRAKFLWKTSIGRRRLMYSDEVRMH